jgi:hypothetical protein
MGHCAAAGAADILAAPADDPDIDTTFVAMGVLPGNCNTKPDAKCPVGFPPAQQGNWLVAG